MARVLVGPSVRLFTNAFGTALLCRLLESVADDGQLVVGGHPEGRARRNGWWSPADLVTLFGSAAVTSSDVVRIEGGAAAPAAPRSTVSLAWRRPGLTVVALAHALATDGPLDGAMIHAWLGDLRDPTSLPITFSSSPVPGASRADGAGGSHRSRATRLLDALDMHGYYLAGVGYKAAAIAEITRHHLSAGWHLVDHGGGPGLLAAELLLESTGCRSAVVVDPDPVNALVAAEVATAFPELRGRFRMSLGPSATFGVRPAECITFIGSLLYTPPDQRTQVLDDAWESLSPGGVLVVHENVVGTTAGRDAHRQMTVADLDGLLSRYGTITRYLSTAPVTVTAEQAGPKTVFRVVAKA